MDSHAEVLRIMRVGYEAHPFPNDHIKEMIADLDAAIVALCASQEWLPIETAPRDGTRVLLLFHFPSGYCIEGGYWEVQKPNTKPRPLWLGDGHRGLGTNWYREFEPTHWQPLPPPHAGEKE